MAGFGPERIDSVQIYDSFSVHVPVALEGFGYCKVGGAGQFLESGATGPGGRLPVNTSGGHLSDSYMQGWNHQVEAVRQLRHVAGERQVPGVRYVHYISDVAGKVVTIVYGAST
jgi:acetyl-CoA acetyltransferase